MNCGTKKFNILVGVFLIKYFDLKYPLAVYDSIFKICLILFLISIVAYVLIIILNILIKSFKSKIIKVLMKIAIVLVVIFMLIETLMLSSFIYVYSYTTDINNYLDLELSEIEDEADTFFPTLDNVKELNEHAYYYKHEVFSGHTFCVGLYVEYDDEQKFTSIVDELMTKFCDNEIIKINDNEFKMRKDLNISQERCESSILINEEKQYIIYIISTTNVDDWFYNYLENN